MDSRDDVSKRLSDAVERFTVPLRMGEGVDDIALGELKSALAAAAAAWRGEPSLPKTLVIFLVEVFPSIDATSHLYPDERGDRIRTIAEEVQEMVWEIVNS